MHRRRSDSEHYLSDNAAAPHRDRHAMAVELTELTPIQSAMMRASVSETDLCGSIASTYALQGSESSDALRDSLHDLDAVDMSHTKPKSQRSRSRSLSDNATKLESLLTRSSSLLRITSDAKTTPTKNGSDSSPLSRTNTAPSLRLDANTRSDPNTRSDSKTRSDSNTRSLGKNEESVKIHASPQSSTEAVPSPNRSRGSSLKRLLSKAFLRSENQAPPVMEDMGSPAVEIVSEALSETPIKPKTYAERVKMFEDAITQDTIDLNLVRDLCMTGVPDSPTWLRASYWKVLLNYYPLDRSRWSNIREESRATYRSFIKNHVLDPMKMHALVRKDSRLTIDLDSNLPVCRIEDAQHPLTTETRSGWKRFFQDRETLYEIDKDVRRTLPQLHFFNQLLGSRGQFSLTPSDEDDGIYEALVGIKRVLFIYAKLNSGIKYVQGMNQVLAPIFYAMFLEDSKADVEDIEADAFYCFSNLMSELRDNFMKDVDDSAVGIASKVAIFDELLRQKDPEVWTHLRQIGLDPQFYAIRWFTLLLSQEFELPDTIRIWDSLFADSSRFQLLLYFCCTMVMEIRQELLDGDFGRCIQLLQVD
eukprot:TRINITY_DN1872_c0_g2_i1.p1 TRINITY_DN1872_c0_g2~~TRINITY_DN1872_c0_g2_i1.p1  ORF type:complete len:589 (-),score=99.14 TRINITY_DN1872_c0_g2_i1:782-2548(-)